MYTEKDLQDISAQLTKRRCAVWVPAAVLGAAVVVCFVLRIEWLTNVLALLLGAGLIFGLGIWVRPVSMYRKHLNNVLHGRTRELTGQFKEMENETVVRDGVKYYPMTLTVGDPEKPVDDRLFYYDANLPRPDWQAGETLTVTSHDKELGNWVRVAAN